MPPAVAGYYAVLAVLLLAVLNRSVYQCLGIHGHVFVGQIRSDIASSFIAKIYLDFFSVLLAYFLCHEIFV